MNDNPPSLEMQLDQPEQQGHSQHQPIREKEGISQSQDNVTPRRSSRIATKVDQPRKPVNEDDGGEKNDQGITAVEDLTKKSKKPRKSIATKKKGKQVQETRTITNLPLEIVSMIFSYLDPHKLIRCLTLSKRFYAALDPQASEGQRTWRLMREKLGFPDPALIDKTDFQFLKEYHERGCSFCDEHPHTRKGFWRFHGLRMCKGCFHQHTEKEAHCYEELHPNQYKHLPFEMENGHRVYLKRDILPQLPTETEIAALKIKTANANEFARQVKLVEDRIADAKAERDAELRAIRKQQVTEYVLKQLPILDEELLSMLPSFQTACNKTTSFTKKSQSAVLKKIREEMEEKRRDLVQHRLKKAILMEYNEPDLVNEIFSLTEYKSLLETITSVPTFDDSKTLVKPVLDVYRRGLAENQNRVKEWATKLPHLKTTTLLEALTKPVLCCKKCRYCAYAGADIEKMSQHISNGNCGWENVEAKRLW